MGNANPKGSRKSRNSNASVLDMSLDSMNSIKEVNYPNLDFITGQNVSGGGNELNGPLMFVDPNNSSLKQLKLSKNPPKWRTVKRGLNLFGKFNALNAGLSESIANYIDKNNFKIDGDVIKNTLENFKPVKGRLEVLKLNDCEIYIGKSDNSDAIKPILEEVDFTAIFVGTPRHNENHRLDILNEVVKANPEAIILFPGLEDTLDQAKFRLNTLDYKGRIEIANNLDEIIAFVAEFSHDPAILIGGNGQENIIKIQDRLKQICDSCNNEDKLLFED